MDSIGSAGTKENPLKAMSQLDKEPVMPNLWQYNPMKVGKSQEIGNSKQLIKRSTHNQGKLNK